MPAKIRTREAAGHRVSAGAARDKHPQERADGHDIDHPEHDRTATSQILRGGSPKAAAVASLAAFAGNRAALGAVQRAAAISDRVPAQREGDDPPTAESQAQAEPAPGDAPDGDLDFDAYGGEIIEAVPDGEPI